MDARPRRATSTSWCCEEITPDLLAEMDAAGLAELLPERVGDAGRAWSPARWSSPTDRSTDHVRLRTTFQGWQVDVRRRSPCSACTPSLRVDPAGWRARPRRDPRQAVADRRRPGRRRHERHRRPRRDARRSTTPGSATRRAGQRGLAADLAGQPRRDPPAAAAAGPDRPRPGRRLAGLARHPTPSTSTAPTTWPWSRRWPRGEADGPLVAAEALGVKVVIAGGTGQVGGILRRALAAAGHDVVVLSRHRETPLEPGRAPRRAGTAARSAAGRRRSTVRTPSQPGRPIGQLPLHRHQPAADDGVSGRLRAGHRVRDRAASRPPVPGCR